jgi:small neutral amino acid transporter SnatA (MarC family)
MRKSYTMISLIFLTFLFMVLVLTYVIADPIDQVYVALLNANTTLADTYENTYIPYYRSATIMALALGVAAPFGYLVVEVFHREEEYNPYEYYRRRY